MMSPRPFSLSSFSFFLFLFFISFGLLSGKANAIFASGKGRDLPTSASQVDFSYSKVAKKAAPAVVTIYAKRVVKRKAVPKFLEPFFRGNPNVNRRRIERALGSGVIVDQEGFIVTNYHVIKGARDLTVSLPDRSEHIALVVQTDEASDLAVLKINTDKKLPFLPFADSDTIEVGDLVLAIGNPFGVGQTITSGIISATARSQGGINDVGFFLQTDAAINQGNSGGALVTLDGKLAGINTAIYSKTGGFMGIGFSVPSNMVYLVARTAIKGEAFRRPWSGATLQDVTSEIARSVGLKKSGGALISHIYPKGPAERAGLQNGDIIVSVGKKDALTTSAFRYHLSLASEKDEVELSYLRFGQLKRTTLPVEVPPFFPPPNYATLTGNHLLVGIRVGNLSPALALELRLPPSLRGVVVKEVTRNAPVARYLRKGDVILSVNDKNIDKVQTLKNVFSAPRPYKVVFRRGQRNYTLNQK